ncbi:MAG: isoaspartyl peptidase/L-asparaginase [Saprospirales bacterium]|nr:MAG: isoaspartyl peptidase/L-asparaginase [Saprospirales bacterium]
MKKKFSIALHGGAGTILRSKMSIDQEKEYRDSLSVALKKGAEILSKGGLALDAVTETVIILEDNPLFNAGKGAVLTHDAEFELDASIMDGRDKSAGAVCGLRNIANPIAVARKIITSSDHILLSAKGAKRFAKDFGFKLVEEDYFKTEYRLSQLKLALKEGTTLLDHSDDKKFGTVGAVALDQNGNLAAATSTGGLTNKKYGRVGDSPIIGAGTWADNLNCAVSCTGNGEAFIRTCLAYEVGARMTFGKMNLFNATEAAIFESLKQVEGEGGLIAIDYLGNISMPFNSEGMYRASLREGGKEYVGIFSA